MGTYFSTFSPAHSQWTKELNCFFFLLICIIIQEMCVLNESNYYFSPGATEMLFISF